MSVSEIFLNLGNLSNEIIKQIWFTEIRDYINLRYDALINRFKKTFDYVTPYKENSNVFSYEYASILRDSGSVFDSTLKQIIHKGGYEYDERIGGMLKFLKHFQPKLEYIRLKFLHYGGFLYPFKPGDCGLPDWWNAYNQVKHLEIENISSGNFRFALTSLAALGVLKESVYAYGDLGIFTIVEFYPENIYHTEFFDYVQFYEK